MRKAVFAELLDNLWFWAVLALGIMAIYGIWALLEATAMHGITGIAPRGWG
ncbi:MAG: hypothetical protein RQ885_03420 [Desulfurococcales archaeon]|jgi:hypothetical protein|nr:hypothetical protein [Desulfurococcales archaeon]